MRFTDPAQIKATNPKVRRWLVEQVAAEKPDAVLLSGDVPWHGGNASDYDEYRLETRIWRDAHLRIYPRAGQSRILQRRRSTVPGKLVERVSGTPRSAVVFRADRKFRQRSQPRQQHVVWGRTASRSRG